METITTSTAAVNLKQKTISFEKKENQVIGNNNIFKTLITSASKNLELFCITLSNAKEKFKNEADSFMQNLKKSEENINKLIEEKTKYYDAIKEKVNGVFSKSNEGGDMENLDLNEDKQIKEIVEECNDFGQFYKYFRTIDEEIKNLEALKENKALREYVENTKSFMEQSRLGDLVASKGLLLESDNPNTHKNISKVENVSFANAPTEAVLVEKGKKLLGNNKLRKDAAAEENSSNSSESDKIANKYVKYETPTSNKFLGKKRLQSSDAEVESTNTNNQDEIDLLKDSEENSTNEDEKKRKNQLATTAAAAKEKANPNNISGDSKTSAKRTNRYAMKREIHALGLTPKTSIVQAKKPNADNIILNNNNSISNNNSKNQTSATIEDQPNKEKQQQQDLLATNQNCSNSVYSETIDLVSSSNVISNSNNPYSNRPKTASAANANSKLKSKGGAKTGAVQNKDSSEALADSIVNAKNEQTISKKQSSINNSNNNKQISMSAANSVIKQTLNTNNPIVKTQKYIENSNELYRNIGTLESLIKRDKHNYLEYIQQNFEESLFKQRIFYCEFDMLNKNRKCASDLLGKDPIFENSENYEHVKLTIVRKGKQNINNLLKSMENFFKQYIKRKDIDGSAVIKGTLNCSFDKLQKYFTMQMRSFEYCEAIQLEVYLFKWDLFYDFNEKEDKTNLDNSVLRQYINFGNVLRETRILEKKRRLMLQMSNMECN